MMRANRSYEHVCEWPECGKTFTSGSSKTRFCTDTHYGVCEVCGKKFPINPSKPSKTCSASCAASLGHTDESKAVRRKNSMKKWGVESPLQASSIKKKIKDTLDSHPEKDNRIGSDNFQKNLQEAYHVDNASKLDSVKSKKSETTLKNYGVDNPMKSKIVKESVKKTNLKRYGYSTILQSPEVSAKARKTMKERFGVEHGFSSPIILDSVKMNNVDKWGAEFYLQTEEGKNHMRSYCQEHYGVDWPSQIEEVKDRKKSTVQKNYGVDNVFQDEAIKAGIRKKLQEEYGVEYVSQREDVKNKIAKSNAKNPMRSGKVSKINKRFAEDLESRIPGVEISYEPVLGKGWNADLKVTNNGKTVLIDLNPTITHNIDIPFGCVLNGCQQPCKRHTAVTRSYHYDRAFEAYTNMNEPYMQFYEWDDHESVLNMIVNKLMPIQSSHKVSSHKLLLQKISQSKANDFLRQYHSQGPVSGQIYCYGLIYDDALVAVSTFGKPRFNKKYDAEWIRYAVKDGWIVYGGQQKLLERFIQDIHPKTILSYLDFNHTTTASTFMNSCGFEELKTTGPTLIWSKPNTSKKITDSFVRSRGADTAIGTHYGSMESCGMNNTQIMLQEGWVRVYTAGNRSFVRTV